MCIRILEVAMERRVAEVPSYSSRLPARTPSVRILTRPAGMESWFVPTCRSSKTGSEVPLIVTDDPVRVVTGSFMPSETIRRVCDAI